MKHGSRFTFTACAALSKSQHHALARCTCTMHLLVFQGKESAVINKYLVSLVAAGLFAATAWGQPPAGDAAGFYQALKKVPADMEASAQIFGEKVQAVVAGGGDAEIDQMKVALMDVLLMLH